MKKTPVEHDKDSNNKQHCDWLRVSSLVKGSQRWNAGGMAKAVRQSKIENKFRQNRDLRKGIQITNGGANKRGEWKTAPVTRRTVTMVG